MTPRLSLSSKIVFPKNMTTANRRGLTILLERQAVAGTGLPETC